MLEIFNRKGQFVKPIIIIMIILPIIFLSFGCTELVENSQADRVDDTIECDYAKPMVREYGDKMSIAIDPKIESAYLVFEMISEETGFSQFEGSPYMDEQIQYFSKYKDHKVFNIATRMVKNGFTYEAIASSLHMFNDDLTLKSGLIPDEGTVAKAGGMVNIQEFVEALYDFRKYSDYDSYFKSNEPLYNQYMDRAEKYIDSSNFYEVFSNHYGDFDSSIKITIAPGCLHGYGCTNMYEDRMELLPTITAGEYDKDFIGLLLHELSHPYVNYETEKRADVLSNTEKLFNPISGPMSSKKYSNWEIALNEHIVRANTIYMMGQIYGHQSTNFFLKRDSKDGFIYIDKIYESIMYYEENRNTYKDFSQYFDKLMNDIEKIEAIN